MKEPRFEHDCPNCEYIGEAVIYERRSDIYVCPQGGFPTVVARYSDDGPDYSSGVHIASDLPRSLRREARLRLEALAD